MTQNPPVARDGGEVEDLAAGDIPLHEDLTDPALYIHRELSMLEFNRRVLAQATDEAMPLLERLRFLTICSTNGSS